jgi:hypothetical protein
MSEHECYEVEMFATGSVGPLPAIAISYVEEVRVGAAAHIVRNDPARVLAQVEAMRRIVALHSGRAPACGWTQGGTGRHDEEPPCATLRALASIWAGHPDWNPEWAVE